jgi:hypothetical protein
MNSKTTLLLASVVYAFTQHPDEVLNICPLGHTPTYDDIRQLKHCKSVKPLRHVKY